MTIQVSSFSQLNMCSAGLISSTNSDILGDLSFGIETSFATMRDPLTPNLGFDYTISLIITHYTLHTPNFILATLPAAEPLDIVLPSAMSFDIAIAMTVV